MFATLIHSRKFIPAKCGFSIHSYETRWPFAKINVRVNKTQAVYQEIAKFASRENYPLYGIRRQTNSSIKVVFCLLMQVFLFASQISSLTRSVLLRPKPCHIIFSSFLPPEVCGLMTFNNLLIWLQVKLIFT